MVAWKDEWKKAFQVLKVYLSTPTILSHPCPEEGLKLYLATSPHAVSVVWTRKED